jgi:hypothetical protein
MSHRYEQEKKPVTTLLAGADLDQKIVAATVRLEPRVESRTADSASLQGVDDLEVAAHAHSTPQDNLIHQRIVQL